MTPLPQTELDAGPLPVPHKAPWGVAEGVGLLAGFVVLQAAVGTVLAAEADRLEDSIAVAVVSDVTMLFVLAAWAQSWGTGQDIWQGLCLRRMSGRAARRALWPAAAGLAAYVGVSVGFASALRFVGIQWTERHWQPIMRMLRYANSPVLLASGALVAETIVPLVEELLFRCVLYLPLRERLGVLPAALTVSAVFAGVHMYPWGVLHLVVLSLTFTALLEQTGSLWAPIAAHGLYNGLTVLAVRLVARGA